MLDALVFDDDPLISDMLEELLLSLGLTVKCFGDGANALLHIRREKPRIVLTDMMMPGLDGVSICMMVRNDPEVAKTKLVVVSGKTFAEDKEKALKVGGADLYVEKPFDVAKFAAEITALLK